MKVGDLIEWLRRCHGALVLVNDVDGSLTLTAHSESKSIKVSEESASTGEEEQRAADERRSDLVAQRNAVFGELRIEAHKRAASAASDDHDSAT